MPINPILKLWYKIFDKDKYQNLKYRISESDRVKYYNTKIFDKILKVQNNIKNNKELSFLHSGHMGDIVYSFPVIKELSKNHNCKLYIQADKPMETDYQNHPSGKIYLDKRIVNLFLSGNK